MSLKSSQQTPIKFVQQREPSFSNTPPSKLPDLSDVVDELPSEDRFADIQQFFSSQQARPAWSCQTEYDWEPTSRSSPSYPIPSVQSQPTNSFSSRECQNQLTNFLKVDEHLLFGQEDGSNAVTETICQVRDPKA